MGYYVSYFPLYKLYGGGMNQLCSIIESEMWSLSVTQHVAVSAILHNFGRLFMELTQVYVKHY